MEVLKVQYKGVTYVFQLWNGIDFGDAFNVWFLHTFDRMSKYLFDLMNVVREKL